MTKAKPHKHVALIKQWADAPDWWDVYFLDTESRWSIVNTIPLWSDTAAYELRKSAKHPDNIKPKKKLIDWSRMPRGAMTNRGEIRAVFGDFVQLEVREKNTPKYDLTIPQNLRLAEQPEFTSWNGQGKPVPEGVTAVYKYISIDASGLPYEFLTNPLQVFTTKPPCAIVVGYRITGLADGWTDNPNESSELNHGE